MKITAVVIFLDTRGRCLTDRNNKCVLVVAALQTRWRPVLPFAMWWECVAEWWHCWMYKGTWVPLWNIFYIRCFSCLFVHFYSFYTIFSALKSSRKPFKPSVKHKSLSSVISHSSQWYWWKCKFSRIFLKFRGIWLSLSSGKSLTLKMKALRSFETPLTALPTTRRVMCYILDVITS